MSASDEPKPPAPTASAVRFRTDVAHVLVGSLKKNGINFSVLLPDSVMHPVNELLLADSTIQTVICSRED
jgi:sulfopyruvate decarboxylase TPP-binding subunit